MSQDTKEKIKEITPIQFEMPASGGVTIYQIAYYLNISASGVRRLSDDDATFPKPRKLLRSIRWDAEEVIAWFKNRERTNA